MNKSDKLKNFVENNGLAYEGGKSAVNSTCTILSGYACYLGFNTGSAPDIESAILAGTKRTELTHEFSAELQRVLNFAYYNNYGIYWDSEEAEKMYNFKKK